MSHPSSRTARKPDATIGWYQLYPVKEKTTTEHLNARQLALRARLRDHYWITGCQPLSPGLVERTCKAMVLLDPQDTMTRAQVDEVMHEDFGFVKQGEAWTIPLLQDEYQTAAATVQARRESATRAGQASGAARRARSSPTPPDDMGAQRGLHDADNF